MTNEIGLLIVQRDHLNDIGIFAGGKMQSIAVSCQSPPGAVSAHVTKQQILLQIVHHVFSRGCSLAQNIHLQSTFPLKRAAKPK
jgi:hypothetical protein